MKNTKVLTEIAILVSLAVVLEVFFTGLGAFFPFLQLPYGGRITLSMMPLFVLTYRQGFKYGIYGGVVYGLLNLLLDAQLWHWASFFLDYAVAFGAIGFGYIGVLMFGKNFKGYAFVAIFGGLFRFVFHFLSGVILFAEYTPEEFSSPVLYSIVYNGYYLVPSVILIIIVSYFMFDRINEEQDLT